MVSFVGCNGFVLRFLCVCVCNKCKIIMDGHMKLSSWKNIIILFCSQFLFLVKRVYMTNIDLRVIHSHEALININRINDNNKIMMNMKAILVKKINFRKQKLLKGSKYKSFVYLQRLSTSEYNNDSFFLWKFFFQF